MGLISNNNIAGVHFPGWEQMPSILPSNATVGSCVCDDGYRYIYYLLSSALFFRICTWTGVIEQLSNVTGSVGAGTCIFYTMSRGTYLNGVLYGSIYALVTSGTGAPIFTRYDIATNVWTALNVTNLPGTFGTNGSMCLPEPIHNNNEGDFHNNAITNVTLTTDINLNATTMSVVALTRNIPANTILNFGTKDTPKYILTNTAVIAGDTSVTIFPAVNAVTTGSIAYYYDHIYLIGNNATQMFRFQISSSGWSSSSANSGNPALPILPGTMGAGCAIRWLPGGSYAHTNTPKDTLVIIRGTNTSTIYAYDMQTNATNTITYHPSTETFGLGSGTMIQEINGKATNLIITKDITQKYFRFDFSKSIKEPLMFQDLLGSGAALAGDRTCIIKHSGIDFIYTILSTSAYMLRGAITF